MLKASLSPRCSGFQLVATGPARGLQDSNCNLTTPDFLAAGPVSKLQGSCCNLTTLGFLFGGRPSQQAAG